MRVLWAQRSATVGDVVAAIAGKQPPAYNTVLTLLRVLEKKGYIRHRKDGRAFTFYPVVDQTQVRRRALRYLMDRFFENSPELLVLNLLNHNRLDPDELERLQTLAAERGSEPE